MSVELRPLGVPCNIRCQYCYQNPQRDTATAGPPYDLDAMKAAIEVEGGPFGLFGGEPLLVPESDLEALWAWGLERFGENGIQTNGTLVSDHHIELFQKYRVRVGISIDGPGAHNDARWAGTLELTRAATAATLRAIATLCAHGIAPSLIITLHRGNASRQQLPRLHSWLQEMADLGVKQVRLHLLEVEDDEIRRKYALEPSENLHALRTLQGIRGCTVDVHQDIDRMLAGSDGSAACVWRACDPYTTAAVRGVEGQGQRSNCGRTNKDGIEFGKASEAGYERYLALYQTPQAAGGCQGCRFFLQCKGQCPGTAIDGDWRNRSEHCAVYLGLFGEREAAALARGELPLSQSPQRLQLEQAMLREWSRGDNPTLASVSARLRNGGPPASPVEEPWRPQRQPVRTIWVSPQAQETWEPRLARIRQALASAASGTVLAEQRPCAIETLLPKEVAAREAELATTGHTLRLLDSRSERGQHFEHQAVIGREDAVRQLRAAWSDGDVVTIGLLLGYPECCVQHFAATPKSQVPLAPDHSLGNLLWRPLGLSALLHEPCSPDCQPSLLRAAQLLAQAQAVGHSEAVEWLHALLRWPVEWSALHSLAEVRTPILKFTYWTEYSDQRLELRYLGTDYPESGASGLHFPYRRPERLKLSESHGHQRGLAHPVAAPEFDVSLSSLLRHGPR